MKVAPKPDSQALELDGLVAHWVSNMNGGNSVFSISLTAIPVEDFISSHQASSLLPPSICLSFNAPSFLHLISGRTT